MFLLFLSSLPHYQAEYLIYRKWPIPIFALTKGKRSKRQLSKSFTVVIQPLSPGFIKLNFCFTLSPTQYHSFFRNWKSIYKCSRGVEPGTTWLKSSKWSERDLNSGTPHFKCRDLTTRPRCLLSLLTPVAFFFFNFLFNRTPLHYVELCSFPLSTIGEDKVSNLKNASFSYSLSTTLLRRELPSDAYPVSPDRTN